MGHLVAVRRWQWALIAALIGLAAYVAGRPGAALRELGESLNDRREFERALVGEVEGRRQFTDVVVHRQAVAEPAGGEREAWVVSGSYCPKRADAGDGKYHWRPTFFVADEPYKPAVDLAKLTAGKEPGRVARFERMERASVADFLDVLGEARGVKYRHAWWRTYAMATWLGGSVLVIGVVWPTVIDLIVFGRLVRRREGRVEVGAAPVARAVEGRDKVGELDEAVGRSIAAADGGAAVVVAAPARKLDAKGQGVAPVAASGKARTFGAKADDFYPTERKGQGR